MRSLPVPVSPATRTVLLVGATLLTSCMTFRMAGDEQITFPMRWRVSSSERRRATASGT